MQRDLFISHASEDNEAVARPLAAALKERGWTVWLDDFELTVGDSLSERIEQGLATSRFGVVVLSPAFFAKAWPQRELRGLNARELSARSKVILPVWHEVDHDYIAARAPILADRLAANTERGLDAVADELHRALTAAARVASASDSTALLQSVIPTDATASVAVARGAIQRAPLAADRPAASAAPAGQSKRLGVRAVIAAGVAVAAAVGGLVAIPGSTPSTAAKKCGSRPGDPARGIYCVNNPCESYPDTCTLPVYSSPGGSAVVGRLEDDEQIHIVCQVRGARFQGHDRATYIWDRLDDGHYISDYFAGTAKVGAFDSRLPRC
jgi:hypothetical protein